MDKKEIALQLTLKAIERMSLPTSSEYKGNTETFNQTFSKQVTDFYNYVFTNLN